MKIVDVCEFYAECGGGVKTYVNQKLEAGAQLGHDVVVIAPGPEHGEERIGGGRVIWIEGPPMPFDPRYYVLWDEAAVHRALDREQPDVVEGSSPWSGGWFAARWSGDAAKAFIYHQDPVAVYPETLFDRWVSRKAINRAALPFWSYLSRLSSHYDCTVTSGTWLAEKLALHGLQRPEPVPFGIDMSRFSPELADEDTRQRLLEAAGAPPDARLLVTVSRMHPEKRFGTILDAFALASRREPMALVVYGDGPLRKWVERRAARVPNVHLAGYTSDPTELPRVLASADAMLHGSAAETYGLVVAEAICSGLPLIVPSIGGAAELAHPSVAETYAPGDVEGGADAIHRLLQRDRRALASSCARLARERVGTMDDHFEALFDLYAVLLEQRRS